jgi:hypothetical protein
MGNALSNTSIGGKYVELVAASSGISFNTSGTLDMITNTINIGQTSSTTNITGVLVGKDGCLAGRTNYVSYNTSTLPATLSTLINMNLFVYLFGSTALKVLTIPVVSTTGQIITIKNGASVDVSLSFTNVMLFDSASLVSAVILQTKGVISIYWGGAFWIQTVPSNAMSELTTTGDIKTITGKLIGSTLDAVVDTAEGTTALKIGNNVITGTIEIGNSQTTGDIKIGLSDAVGATITVGTANTATTINGTLTSNNGLTLASDKYITTGHSTSISGPTLQTQVGYTITPSNGGSISTTVPNNALVSSVSSITLSTGVWFLTATRNINNTNGCTRVNWSFGDTLRSGGPTGNSGDYKWGVSTLVPNGQLNYMTLTGIVTALVPTTVYFNLYLEYSTPTPSITSTANINFNAVRIA